ncbi:Zinc-finger double-stranded RNA-binding [Halogranum amylolyticum]|uniref:Zinc-finger double-stranded RNA-binding n=1 Tax=Halogranum amylolyticum TaxID=660520 RepID=A0A1H8NBK9_9EURY|nr:C2H2-type zinc finger protein [Halogranum amylolyticum]SEO26967.1 Zinc-finger double-stranded RNA-binding [Halogranum amylolyticum]
MNTVPETTSDLRDDGYRCDACGREFRTEEALVDHINSVGLVY